MIDNRYMFFNKRKTIILTIIAVTIFLPGLVLADTNFGSKIPELNLLCWQKTECEKAGGGFAVMKSGPCKTDHPSKPEGGDWGQCLPAGAVTISIGIGGKNIFTDAGDYILTVYNYAVRVAGIIAVAVIIVAGLQWLTSGGNSDTISRAQKRIFGAVIGLVIAYASYFILNNINPALVNLSLPRTWMVRSQTIAPEKCSQLDPKIKLAEAADYTDQTKKVTLSGKEKYEYSYEELAKFKKSKEKDSKGRLKANYYYCGKRFFVHSSAGATCFSDYCDDGDVCVPFGPRDIPAKPSMKYICKKTSIGGVIKYSGNATKGTDWNKPHITNENDHQVWGLCKDGTMEIVEGKAETYTNEKSGGQAYTFTTVQKNVEEVVEHCKSSGEDFVGFVMMMPMDESGDISDENHWIGIKGSGSTEAIDLGISNLFFRTGLIFNQKVKMNRNQWNAGVKKEHLIDVGWQKFTKGSSIEININADYIYDVDSTYTKEQIKKYAEVLEPAAKKDFLQRHGIND